MESSERSSSDGRTDLRVRLATMVGGGAAAAVALVWRPDLGGFWPGLIAFTAMLTAGLLLGRLVGGLLFRPSLGGPPDPPPHA